MRRSCTKTVVLDDGIKIYELEFIRGKRGYEYDINAVSGKILDKDIDVLYK